MDTTVHLRDVLRRETVNGRPIVGHDLRHDLDGWNIRAWNNRGETRDIKLARNATLVGHVSLFETA